MSKKNSAYACLIFICLVWGTTYLFTRVAVASFPAFTFSGIRNVAAGLLLLGVLPFTGNRFTWTRSAILPNVLAGMMIVGLGNGLITWSVRFIPSGLAAMICTLMPVLIVLLSLLTQQGGRVNRMILTGIAFGLLGMGFIFHDNLKDLGNPEYAAGMGVAFAGCLSWSAGTLFSRTRTAHTNSFYNAALQLLSGGILTLVLSLFSGDWSHLSGIKPESIASLVYLIVVGSSAAFAAYQYALNALPVGLVATYAYVNPLIAVILGYAVLSEKITGIMCLAFVLTIAGVYLVNKGYQTKKISVS
ncbi:MAG TPA: EamA family transporter [Bacteroidia bacterium]|jgi:drug/metabolite transporter (DMT)-like permease|nr:EamA family transporter [Bacteroidia bacterium]